ncbi:hypothetical protein [Paenibacillus piri]|uniref:Uncharacterized protein n=1 Tax=Paenibacillus piri TaxID=2547395 RepID=A0A4R5KMB7_9BACL|nr:hypothetical protein [Paenibacillus piri]TDF96753.1 hypothetical protein E1757_16890 [Paenibacillus piri]
MYSYQSIISLVLIVTYLPAVIFSRNYTTRARRALIADGLLAAQQAWTSFSPLHFARHLQV